MGSQHSRATVCGLAALTRWPSESCESYPHHQSKEQQQQRKSPRTNREPQLAPGDHSQSTESLPGSCREEWQPDTAARATESLRLNPTVTHQPWATLGNTCRWPDDRNIIALHCTAPQCTALHCTAPQRTALHRTAPQCTALHCTAQHCTAPHHNAPHHNAVHCTAPQRTALHCTAPQCTALHCTALHCTAMHCTALHCTAPQCTALHCTHQLRTIYKAADNCGCPRVQLWLAYSTNVAAL